MSTAGGRVSRDALGLRSRSEQAIALRLFEVNHFVAQDRPIESEVMRMSHESWMDQLGHDPNVAEYRGKRYGKRSCGVRATDLLDA
jgi:hypothetical protein